MRIVGLSLCVAFVFLGTLWLVDRRRRWERPRLEPTAFEILRGQSAAGRGSSRAIVLVPLHPGCPHCLASWQRLMSACPGAPQCDELVALLVDQERPPSTRMLDHLRASRIWWDRRGIWRHRWGHRIYGERLRFDASGSYLGTSPPPGAP